MNARQEWRNAITDSRLDSSAKLVALVLDRYMDGHGEAWPSRATLAGSASVNPSTVVRAIHRLEAAGFVAAVRSKGRRSNTYRATMPNRGTAPPLEDSNHGRNGRQPWHGATRTRSTEQEEHAHAREEPKPAAGAYRKFDQPPPSITVDELQLDRARAWLSEHRL